MRLVVETNVLFSLFKNTPSFKQFIRENDLDLFSPDKLLNELDKHSDRICKVSGLSEKSYNSIRQLLPDIVSIMSVSPKQIKSVTPLISDPKDTPFLALAVSLGCSIWSNDKHFKEQAIVDVFTTSELIKELESSS